MGTYTLYDMDAYFDVQLDADGSGEIRSYFDEGGQRLFVSETQAEFWYDPAFPAISTRIHVSCRPVFASGVSRTSGRP